VCLCVCVCVSSSTEIAYSPCFRFSQGGASLHQANLSPPRLNVGPWFVVISAYLSPLAAAYKLLDHKIMKKILKKLKFVLRSPAADSLLQTL
jgi:hypothetical protein